MSRTRDRIVILLLSICFVSPSAWADDETNPPPPEKLPGLMKVEGVAVEVVGPARIVRDAPSDYRVVVRHRGTQEIADFYIEARVPDAFQLMTSEPTAEVEGKILRWKIDRFEKAERRDFTFTVKATSAGSGRVEAFALRHDPLAPDVADPINQEGPPKLPEPENAGKVTLRLEMPDRVSAGSPFVCEAIITNDGTTPVENAGFALNLTDGLTLRQPPQQGEGPLSLAAGESRKVTLDLVAAQPGTHGVRATVEAEGGLKVQAIRDIVVAASDLSVRLEVPGEHVMGMPLKFRMFIANNRNEQVPDVQGFIALPEGIEVVSAEAGALLNRRTRTMRWRVGKLEPNEERGFRVTVRPLTAAKLSFAASAKSSDGLTGEQSQSVQVQGHTSLGVSLEPSLDVAPPGELISVTFDIRSRGTDPASDVVLRFEGSEGLEVAADRSIDWKPVDGHWEFRAAGGLGAGQSLKAIIVVRATKPGDYLLKGIVTSRETVGDIVRTQPLKIISVPAAPAPEPLPGT